MAIVNLYSVCDSVAKEFGPVFYCKNHEVAERAFHELIDDTSNPLDYVLYHLGTFDTEIGNITPVTLPERVNLVPFFDEASKDNKILKEDK